MIFRDISGKEEADQTFDSFTRKKSFWILYLGKKKKISRVAIIKVRFRLPPKFEKGTSDQESANINSGKT